MALGRAQLLSIINALSDDKLLQALSTVGVELGEEASLDLGAEDAADLKPWSEMKVAMPPSNKPPLFNKGNIEVPAAPATPERPVYMPPQEPMADIAAYMNPDGTI